MRLRFLLLSVLVLAYAAGAHAGTLTNATWFQVVEGIPMTRSFGQLNASGTSTSALLAVDLTYPFFSTTVFVPKTPNGVLDLAVQVTQGGSQAITATASMANGSPGIPGTLLIKTAPHVGKGINESTFKVGANTVVAIPLSAGKAGLFTGTFTVIGAQHMITVQFYAWTPHTLVFTGLTSVGEPLPDVTAAGSFNLNSQGGGTVTLVSPSKVSIDGSLSQRRTVGITTLALSFVPEPGALLLLGAAGLALWVRRRRRA